MFTSTSLTSMIIHFVRWTIHVSINNTCYGFALRNRHQVKLIYPEGNLVDWLSFLYNLETIPF